MVGGRPRVNYSTLFSGTENPISEGGNWINGGVTGLDWADVQKTPGFAFNTTGAGLLDATAVLTGSWRSDQQASGIVRVVNLRLSNFQECEIRLRTSISAHSISGYEFNNRCARGLDSNSYTQIVRWNGPANNFTVLVDNRGTQYGVTDGDVLLATAIGSVLSCYVNGILVAQTTDTTFQGSPGIGLDVNTLSNPPSDFGFSSFQATDLITSLQGNAGIINADYQWLGGDE